MFDETKFQEALALPACASRFPSSCRATVPAVNSPHAHRAGTQRDDHRMVRRLREEDRLLRRTRLRHRVDAGVGQKYWWSWLMRDMSLNHELYTEDLRYKDPSTFGRILVGQEEFVTYNFAFFDAIPDWRYDPLPGQVYIDLTPDGELRMCIRYIGTGHFSGALKFYPRRQRPGVARQQARSCSVRPSTGTTSMPTDSCARVRPSSTCSTLPSRRASCPETTVSCSRRCSAPAGSGHAQPLAHAGKGLRSGPAPRCDRVSVRLGISASRSASRRHGPARLGCTAAM